MKRVLQKRTLGLCFVLLALNACTGVSVKETLPDSETAYQQRAEQLRAIEEWKLVGRISLDDGDRGGSGRLQWDVKTDRSELDFHGAMGRGAWHLEIGPEAATLKEANGVEQIAPDVNGLIQNNLGWQVPMDALHWWVRGLAAPGVPESQELDEEGLLTSLDQFGWAVEFSRYDSVAGFDLPKRLNATRDNYRVKLAISRWQLPEHASTN